MAMISEKIELLGKNLYTDIPGTLTLKSIPTASELEYVGSEDFVGTMLDSILPEAVDENLNFHNLLEVDYYWICRCLRILNYGPYYTTNAVYCRSCGKVSYGEFRVNLKTINCIPIPDDFSNDIVVSKDEFLDFSCDVHLALPTIQQIINCRNDKAFQTPDGNLDSDLARICYMVTSIGGKSNLTPIEIKYKIKNDLSAADYIILRDRISELSDFGLRNGGTAQCPKCHSNDASFVALVNDKFFRPSLGDLRQWKHDRSAGENKNISRSATATIRKHN